MPLCASKTFLSAASTGNVSGHGDFIDDSPDFQSEVRPNSLADAKGKTWPLCGHESRFLDHHAIRSNPRLVTRYSPSFEVVASRQLPSRHWSRGQSRLARHCQW